MLENIKVWVDGEEVIIKKGMTLLELSKNYNEFFIHSIVIARVDNEYRELSEIITEECHITFLDLTDRMANKIYLNGLVFLLNYCFNELYKNKGFLITKHSIDKALYIESTRKLTKEMIQDLENRMKEAVKDNLKIHKVTISREDAIKYFADLGDIKKAGLLEYMTNTYVNLYRIGNSYNYMFSLMPAETSCLSEFKLTYLNEDGFVLRFPTTYINDEIPKYKHHPSLFEVFKESKELCKLMNLETSYDLNNIISEGKISDLIRITETLHSNRVLNVAKTIAEGHKVKIVLIAGPSSSGKTTTTKKLSMYLRSFGLSPKMLSMDDFFLEREETPRKENGEYDFENIEAIDLKLFNETMDKLLKGEEVILPIFNFITGKKEFTEDMQLHDNDILLIEGIHCLNPRILPNIENSKKRKIYLSALTEINIDKDNRLSTTDNRLIRRLIRDHYTRGYEPYQTIAMWGSVRDGEEQYIFPYQDEADVVLNTGLVYEFPVLKTYGLPLLYTVKRDNPYYEEAKRLIRLLEIFLPVPSDHIPTDSIIREFIGGSYFD